IEYLEKSPLFNLSLSSKELFHSNFIAWIVDLYKNEFSVILSQRLGLKITEIKKIERETKNIDLSIHYKNENEDRLIVIENKVKSLPDKKQLEKYQEKFNS